MLVNGNVVVVPAQCCEVVGIMGAAVRPPFDVVRLEAVSGIATIHGAAAVSLVDEGSDVQRNGSRSVGSGNGLTVVPGDDDADTAAT